MPFRAYRGRKYKMSARALRAWGAIGVPGAFAIRAAAGDQAPEILLYQEIGDWGVSAQDFVLALATIGDGPLVVRINSPGGDVFQGMAIYNALVARTDPVTINIDGLAASAASLVAMAGSTINMAEASQMMIHNCWGFCVGDRNDMQRTAAIQAKIDGQMATIYGRKMGQSADAVAALLDAETWYTADEAKAAGLCDDVLVAPDPTQALRDARLIALSPRFSADGMVDTGDLPDYDPDGDGDNDAVEALGHLTSASTLIGTAINCLTGADKMGAKAPRRLRAAATDPEWICSAAEDLPIDTATVWDGPAAQERIFEWAGFNGNSPDPAKAKQAFLAWDHHNPNLKGSYKLPFADIVGDDLKALKGGIDAAASRLPDTDIPADVKQKGRDVLDAYETRMNRQSAILGQLERLEKLARVPYPVS